jgi:hypothetical protein
MAIALKNRRVASIAVETTRGTFLAPTAGADEIPTIREATFTINPVSVERPTLRLSMTAYPDTYPGVATCEVRLIVEMGGLPANPKTDYDMPVWADLLRGCGFEEVSNANGGLKPRLLQNVTNLTGGTAGTPLRHGEAVVGNGGTIAGAGTVIGDFFFEDDVLCVQETTAPTGTALTTWTGATSSRVATGTRGANSVGAFRLNSDVNGVTTPASTQTLSGELYLDGKRLRYKGAMGNAEFLFDHGDMIRMQVTLSGVVNAYADVAMPTAANELHKVAPTFLGKELRIYEIASAPKGYGRDAATFANDPEATNRSVIGAINTMRLNTGNNVVLRQNSFDQFGVTNALITGRKPTGSFNPDEVLVAEYDWVGKFIAGTPMRLKAMMGSAGTVTTQDGNTVDFMCPGIVISGLGDGDRDAVHAWDGQFKVTGGDYDTSAAGEAPGNDNEFTIIYR